MATTIFPNSDAKAQCGYGGTNYGDVTPAGVGDVVELINYVWGGDQFTLQAQSGCTYTISTCGGGWDTQITVFDAGLNVVGYNDDACGYQSIVTFTAATTGAFTIQVNEYFCGTNLTDLPYFSVSIDSCAGGCNDISACNYQAGSTDNSNCCYDNCVSFELFDSFGDGWNGATYSLVNSGGVSVALGTLGAGAYGVDELCVPDDCYLVVVGGGSFDSEISWTISGIVGGAVSGGSGLTEVGIGVIMGCTNSASPNYNPAAVCDDGSCLDCYDASDSGCPDIDCGIDIVVPACTTPCTPVPVACEFFDAGETTSYSVCGIDYNPPYSFYTGTPFSINTDDVWSGSIALPFDFCFYGVNYSEVNVGSNNCLTFDTYLAGDYCPFPFTDNCPSPNLPLNSIFGPYHDIDPSVCGTPTYAILGSAPCRAFVVNYPEICHFSCNSIMSTTQIVLYETTNVIEVYIQDKPTCPGWNNGNAVVGIQNATGLVGITPSTRQTGPWTASNEGWRFTPTGTSIVSINWFDQSDGSWVGSGSSIDVCPEEDVQTFVAEATYTKCDGTTISVWDDVVVTCAMIMLPVELTSFDAIPDEERFEVNCIWETATEKNNEHFIVQRSLNGLNWEDVGKVSGAGTTFEPQSYSWVDHSPHGGQSYYRLKQVDFNGEFWLSPLRSVWLMEDEVSIYPNPGNGIFTFSGLKENTTIQVWDARGRHVQLVKLSGNQFMLQGVSKGVYLLEVRTQHGQQPKHIRLLVN